MPTEANTVLSESEVAEIEAQKPYKIRHIFLEPRIVLTIAERDALCATP